MCAQLHELLAHHREIREVSLVFMDECRAFDELLIDAAEAALERALAFFKHPVEMLANLAGLLV
jgi:hypothetical protein